MVTKNPRRRPRGSVSSELLKDATTACDHVRTLIQQVAHEFEPGTIAKLRAAIASLYLLLSAAPDIEPTVLPIPTPPALPEDENADFADGILAHLKRADESTPSAVATWSTQEREEQLGFLSADLSSLHTEVCDALWYLHHERVRPRDALWATLFGFWTHWGDSALRALLLLHSLEPPRLVE